MLTMATWFSVNQCTFLPVLTWTTVVASLHVDHNIVGKIMVNVVLSEYYSSATIASLACSFGLIYKSVRNYEILQLEICSYKRVLVLSLAQHIFKTTVESKRGRLRDFVAVRNLQL